MKNHADFLTSGFKISKETVTPQKSIGDNLNYNFDYVYDENFAHRLINAGDRYYKYDANGNIICEQDGSFESNGEDASYHKITQEAENVYSTDYGWGLFKENDSNSGIKGSRYCRTYTWNERNQLISSVDSNYSTAYVYGQDGQRSNKYTQNSETLYFNKMWTLHTDSGNNVYGGQTAKNIYLGETRIVTKLNSGENPTYQEEYYKQYYYHSDHLGSASLISDYKGDEYQRIEYTPYGETWVEKTQNTGLEFLPYRFTGKEIDEETGLYYYGARYLDPKYSMWISTDPALGEYIPKAPINEEAKRYNQNLPGMCGVFNTVNGNLYHYAGNNPVRYIDPDGREIIKPRLHLYQNSPENKSLPMGATPSGKKSIIGGEVTSQNTIGQYGCLFTSLVNIADDVRNKRIHKYAPSSTNVPNLSVSSYNNNDKYFTYSADYTSGDGYENDANMLLDNMKSLLSDAGLVAGTKINITEKKGADIKDTLAELSSSGTDNAYVIGHYNGHFFNVTGYDSQTGNVTINDVYIRTSEKASNSYLNNVNNNGMDKIYVIRIED